MKTPLTKPVIVTVPHQLGKEEAKRRLQAGLEQVRGQVSAFATSVEEGWRDDRWSFRVVALAQTVTGRLDVRDDAVQVEVDLPWALALLAEKLKGRIRSTGTLLLDKPPPAT